MTKVKKMKQTKYILLLALLVAIVNYSCERDDICAESTPTTPSLIITFYDVSDPDELEPVNDLRAFGIDDDDELIDVFNATQSSTDSIVLPLRTDADETRFVIYRDYELDDNDTDDENDDMPLGNADTITISYDREEIYVSRACGFKTIFNNIVFTIEEEIDNPDEDLGNWLLQFILETENNSILDETTAHINIFH